MDGALRPRPTLRILIADAAADQRTTLAAELADRLDRPTDILEAGDLPTLTGLASGGADVIVANVATLGGPAGVAALAHRAGGATIYATGPAHDVTSAVASVSAGAADYLDRPVDVAALVRRIERQFPAAAASVAEDRVGGLVCRSAAMRRLVDQTRRIARSPAPALVTGAPATGKARLARLVHELSPRRAGPFVALDCRGLGAGDLMEALGGPGGALDRALGGTLHLSHVQSLSHGAQGVVLQLVDTGEVFAAGRRTAARCRLVVSVDLDARRPDTVGGIRPDLYFRLAVLPLRMPALAERPEDVGPVAADLLGLAAARLGRPLPRLSAGAEAVLAAHGWTGNIEQLRAVCMHLCERLAGSLIGPEQIRPILEETARRSAAPARPAMPLSAPRAPQRKPVPARLGSPAA